MYYNDKVFAPFLESHFAMQLYQIREAVKYVAKFLALNLELEPPDCTGLGDNPEDVSLTIFGIDALYHLNLYILGQNRGVYRSLDSKYKHA